MGGTSTSLYPVLHGKCGTLLCSHKLLHLLHGTSCISSQVAQPYAISHLKRNSLNTTQGRMKPNKWWTPQVVQHIPSTYSLRRPITTEGYCCVMVTCGGRGLLFESCNEELSTTKSTEQLYSSQERAESKRCEQILHCTGTFPTLGVPPMSWNCILLRVLSVCAKTGLSYLKKSILWDLLVLTWSVWRLMHQSTSQKGHFFCVPCPCASSDVDRMAEYLSSYCAVQICVLWLLHHLYISPCYFTYWIWWFRSAQWVKCVERNA